MTAHDGYGQGRECVAEQDEVKLSVPATPEFLRLARVTATGLASRLGFTYDEVEDLRLAIDELCFTLIGSRGRPGVLRLRYLLAGPALEVEGVGEFDDDSSTAEPALSDLSKQILAALVEFHDVTRNADGLPSFQLRKRHLDPAVR